MMIIYERWLFVTVNNGKKSFFIGQNSESILLFFLTSRVFFKGFLIKYGSLNFYMNSILFT